MIMILIEHSSQLKLAVSQVPENDSSPSSSPLSLRSGVEDRRSSSQQGAVVHSRQQDLSECSAASGCDMMGLSSA
ncbi:hypothetical protein PBY51_017056 [Eleginops maclovinus]|uniref:Uncharacterized protein n=1 Tax=Eleginops maclovinus TaxID=56733 RepID=A0AAN7WV57_ELEMC|nr:hypothetical protein PBY51_017056 [Eleginops maclovinus]